MPFDEFEPINAGSGMSVGSGDMALDASFDHLIPSKPSRVMPPGLSKFHDNESLAHASAQRNPKLIYDIKHVNWDPHLSQHLHTLEARSQSMCMIVQL
eukprot:952494-Prymnesium_polylepis.1